MNKFKNRFLLLALLVSILFTGCGQTTIPATPSIPLSSPSPTAKTSHLQLDTYVKEVMQDGSLLLACTYSQLLKKNMALYDKVTFSLNTSTVTLPVCQTDTDVDLNAPYVRIDEYANEVYLSMHLANFKNTYHIGENDKVIFALDEKNGYYESYMAHQLSRTDTRDDYDSDSAFANFRSVRTTGIQHGILYRSGNPLWRKNFPHRPPYANKLLHQNKVQTILNFSNSKAEIQNILDSRQSSSYFYIKQFQKGNIFCRHSSTDLTSKSFVSDVIASLQYLSTHDGPYLIHCNDGKDRTGFVCALLECLMGASLEEVTDDYMVSFENYFHVLKGTKQWSILAEGNIQMTLARIFFPHDTSSTALQHLKVENLSILATNYLEENGMTSSQINRLRTVLSTN